MMIDPLTEVVRHLSQAAGILAYLLGFCVFMLIHRITKDAGYLVLSMGFLLHFLLGLTFVVLFRLLGFVISPGMMMPIFQYLVPFLQVLAGILMIAGFLMVGTRRLKKMRNASEERPSS